MQIKLNELTTEGQRKKSRDMQLEINRYNQSGGEEHSKDEELDNLETEDDNS